MKRILFLLVLAILGGSFAHAGYRAKMEGDTQVEKEIRWVWKYLYEFTLSCAASNKDCQAPEVKSLISQLNTYLPAYDAPNANGWGQLLKFVSEKDRPDLFQSAAGEAHRNVMTGTTKMSPIFINTDRMDMPLETWVGLLIHEACHHLGIPDDGQRLPDVVGAAVAKHFATQVQFSSFEQFGAPQVHVLIFNSMAPRVSSGFFSWGSDTSDLDWGSSPLQQVCLPNETITREHIGAPAWRVNFVKSLAGLVKVRGGGLAQAECTNNRTGQKRTALHPIDAAMDLQFPLPFDFDAWQTQTPKVIWIDGRMGVSMNPNDHMFGAGQTFLIEQTTHSKKDLMAGETLKSQFILKSIDNFLPQSCQLMISGTEYSMIGQDSLPGVNFYQNCHLKSLGQGKWQVEGELTFPKATRPDHYYVPVIILAGAGSERVAMPTVPEMIRVQNPGAPPSPKIKKIEVIGLKPARNIGVSDVTASYLAPTEQPFTVEFDILGPQVFDELWVDAYIWTPLATEFGVLGITGSSDSMEEFFVSRVEIKKMSDRSRVIIHCHRPDSVRGIKVAAIKFMRFSLRTSDFSWVEIEMPDKLEAMVIDPKWEH